MITRIANLTPLEEAFLDGGPTTPQPGPDPSQFYYTTSTIDLADITVTYQDPAFIINVTHSIHDPLHVVYRIAEQFYFPGDYLPDIQLWLMDSPGGDMLLSEHDSPRTKWDARPGVTYSLKLIALEWSDSDPEDYIPAVLPTPAPPTATPPTPNPDTSPSGPSDQLP